MNDEQYKIEPRADLRSANLRSANLESADLRDANLVGANLRSANLRSADLRDAILRDAILESAILESADLGGADLRGAILRGADLRGVKIAVFQVDWRTVYISPDAVRVGCMNLTAEKWMALPDEELSKQAEDGPEFRRRWQDVIIAIQRQLCTG